METRVMGPEMTGDTNLDARFRRAFDTLASRSQNHVLRWWDELSLKQRERLLADVESIPWNLLDDIMETHVRCKPSCPVSSELSPPTVYRQQPPPGRESWYAQAIRTGREWIRQGKVAAFTVAGGQGTRLGFDGPKGALPVTPVGDRTLFEIFAETIKAVRRRYATPIPWYIMTSPANHTQTHEYFAKHGFFGLPPRDVMLFSQGMLPTFDFQGRLLLEEKHRLALAPDGHGGSLTALAKSGALDDMRSRGIDTLSYFQVDNPLVKPFDPLFIGLHVVTRSQMSTKVAAKADDLERVGNVCLDDGRVTVIEYCDFPAPRAHERNPDGSRKFNAGNLAIHLLDVGLIHRVTEGAFSLPLRRAEKTVSYIDRNGRRQEPATPNAVKLETFIFDVLPLVSNPLLLEVDRAEEFAPVKNATGPDSLETAKRAQIARACRWVEQAGVRIPRRRDGEPAVTIAISPALALGAEDLKEHIDRLPQLRPGDVVYIE